MADNCVFCKIAKKEINASIVREDDDIIAFIDKEPQAPVHVIVIPKEHMEKVSAMTKDEEPIIGKMVAAAHQIAADKGINASGYRLVINCGKDGGQLVGHLHLHLLGGRALGWPPG